MIARPRGRVELAVQIRPARRNRRRPGGGAHFLLTKGKERNRVNYLPSE